MKYTIVQNNIVVNVIEADETFILANHDDDIVVEGEYRIGYLFVDGAFVPPTKIIVDVADIVATTGYTGDLIVKPVLPLTNITLSSEAVLTGDIYWLQQGVLATVTATVGLPDGDYMLMAERVIDADTVVDDVRFKANVSSCLLTMNVNFQVAGNYLISAKRLNEGFDRIGSPVHLSFPNVEFDIYV